MHKALLAALLAVAFFVPQSSSRAAEGPALPAQAWSFKGAFGTYDRAAVRRGLQVYREVCAACHSLNLVAFRHLGDVGFQEAEIKAVAEAYKVKDGPDDAGDMFERAGRPSDYFPAPFANTKAARASNGGALPPDLSLMTKARKQGPDYVYALLTGFKAPPAGFSLMAGMNYNEHFPGRQIAMAPPLAEGALTFADGTQSSVSQMARDVTTFLSWTAEPEMEARKRLGVKVLLFLLVLTGLLYALKRAIWQKLH